MVLLVFKVLQGLQGSQDKMVHLDRLVIVGLQVIPVPLGMLDRLVIQAIQDLLERLAHQGALVILDNQAL